VWHYWMQPLKLSKNMNSSVVTHPLPLSPTHTLALERGVPFAKLCFDATQKKYLLSKRSAQRVEFSTEGGEHVEGRLK
jgi:hypothetical protein